MKQTWSQHVLRRRRLDRERVGIQHLSSLQRGSATHATVTVLFGIFALVLVGSLGLFYLQQVVGTASSGTEIREIEERISELKERQRILELEGAELRSLQVVEERAKELNLIGADRVTFLVSTDDKVAARQ